MSRTKLTDLGAVWARDFAQSILTSAEYRANLLKRAIAGELAPAMEAMLWHYYAGKPADRLEADVSVFDLSSMSTEELAERAAAIAAKIRDKRAQQEQAT